jgi:hypothetical protein
MKKLVIEVLKTPFGTFFRIVIQTHIGGEFADGHRVFTASNGFILSSANSVQIEHNGLWVRGSSDIDEIKPRLILSEKWLSGLRVAVKEYNIAFGNISIDHQSECTNIEVLK